VESTFRDNQRDKFFYTGTRMPQSSERDLLMIQCNHGVDFEIPGVAEIIFHRFSGILGLLHNENVSRFMRFNASS
jgi:hypothetical protein